MWEFGKIWSLLQSRAFGAGVGFEPHQLHTLPVCVRRKVTSAFCISSF
jgi:hypothetical protein